MSNKANPLAEGTQVPFFKTWDEQGEEHGTLRLMGQSYLLYFYPRDNTPGCTLQACGFRDLHHEFKSLDLKIFGISGGDRESHRKFRKKLSLPFPLLLDEDHAIARAFGVYGEKKFMGKVFDGIHRTSFLIDSKGSIARVWAKVKAGTHPVDALRELQDT